jgi:hypothetical protein
VNPERSAWQGNVGRNIGSHVAVCCGSVHRNEPQSFQKLSVGAARRDSYAFPPHLGPLKIERPFLVAGLMMVQPSGSQAPGGRRLRTRARSSRDYTPFPTKSPHGNWAGSERRHNPSAAYGSRRGPRRQKSLRLGPRGRTHPRLHPVPNQVVARQLGSLGTAAQPIRRLRVAAWSEATEKPSSRTAGTNPPAATTRSQLVPR